MGLLCNHYITLMQSEVDRLVFTRIVFIKFISRLSEMGVIASAANLATKYLNLATTEGCLATKKGV